MLDPCMAVTEGRRRVKENHQRKSSFSFFSEAREAIRFASQTIIILLMRLSTSIQIKRYSKPEMIIRNVRHLLVKISLTDKRAFSILPFTKRTFNPK